MVRAQDLKSVGRGFKSRSDRQLMLLTAALSSTSLVNSQLVCLPPAGILSLVMFIYLSLFVYIVPEKPRWGVANYLYIRIYT